MALSKKGESEVGYKRPPVESRFKKGQSGNPQGRRRQTPATTVAAMLAEALQSTAVISENGRRLKISKMRGLIDEAIKQGMHGNFQPLALITKISPSLEQLTSPTTRKDEEDEFSHLSDDELEEQLQQRMLSDDKFMEGLLRKYEQLTAKKKGDQGSHD